MTPKLAAWTTKPAMWKARLKLSISVGLKWCSWAANMNFPIKGGRQTTDADCTLGNDRNCPMDLYDMRMAPWGWVYRTWTRWMDRRRLLIGRYWWCVDADDTPRERTSLWAGVNGMWMGRLQSANDRIWFSIFLVHLISTFPSGRHRPTLNSVEKERKDWGEERARESKENGSEADGRNTEKTGNAELPQSQCSCTVSPLRRHGALRPSRVALLPVRTF